MNKITKLLMICLIVVASASCDKGKTIVINNNSDIYLPDHPLVIKRAHIEKNILGISEDKLPVLKDTSGKYIPTQVEDIDLDGKWDELVAIYDLKANESVEFNISLVDKKEYPEFKARTNARLAVKQDDGSFKSVTQYVSPAGFPGKPIKFQMESVAWENDKIAFRNYFDVRNAKDLFGKLTTDMVLDNVGIGGNYHKLADWGMDILHCGASLGSGGLALKRGDNLYRLGNVKHFEFKLISKGVIRTILELRYEGWEVEGSELSATERITLWAGQNWFKSDVKVKGTKSEDKIVTGIVTSQLKNTKPFFFNPSDKYICGFTHDNQSEIKDMLGMAVITSKDSYCCKKFIGKSDIKDFDPLYKPIEDTYCIAQNMNEGKSTHYFMAVWGRQNNKANKREGFENLIKKEVKEIESEISVVFK